MDIGFWIANFLYYFFVMYNIFKFFNYFSCTYSFTLSFLIVFIKFFVNHVKTV